MNVLETTVLIAEDNDAHAELISSNLQRAGLLNPLVRFRDGEEVLRYLSSNDVNGHSYVLLLDIKMPRTDGVEVLRRVKASPVLRRVPVIIVTTTDDPHEVARCHDIGCSSYVTKPIDPDKFREAIQTLGLFLMVVEVPEVDGQAGMA